MGLLGQAPLDLVEENAHDLLDLGVGEHEVAAFLADLKRGHGRASDVGHALDVLMKRNLCSAHNG